MSFFEKFFGGVFALVLVYLLVRNWRGVNGVLSGFASFNTQLITALQGNAQGVQLNFTGLTP
jgi:hypothetical protein